MHSIPPTHPLSSSTHRRPLPSTHLYPLAFNLAATSDLNSSINPPNISHGFDTNLSNADAPGEEIGDEKITIKGVYESDGDDNDEEHEDHRHEGHDGHEGHDRMTKSYFCGKYGRSLCSPESVRQYERICTSWFTA
jgi:hypothetical protein